ncbi:MAG: sigma-70 family RNA polymerase sigma factor [Bacteroidetes bacterium]|nr:sigma-70 family RNA polymerase sigma factor [Bacteroidota bacterium]
MTESDIIRGCVKNDRRCQNQLYQQYFPLMSSIARRYFESRDDALMAINYGFLKVLQNIEKFNPEYSLATWIRNILINHIVDELRKKKSYADYIQLSDAEEDFNQAQTNLTEGKWEEEELRTMLAALPQSTANVFNLFAMDGFSHREIAVKLRISEGTSKWHVSEARKRLKVLLNQKLKCENKLGITDSMK